MGAFPRPSCDRQHRSVKERERFSTPKITALRPVDREAVEHRQRLEAIGLMAGTVVHDLRNLLQAITCRVELMQARGTTQAGFDAIFEVIDTADGALQNLRDFIQQSPAREDVVKLETVQPSLHRLLQFLLPRTISLTIDFTDATWPVRVNVSRLQLAILNLAVNARDAMPNGGPLVVKATNATLGDALPGYGNKFVSISVLDAGCGMSDEVTALACKPFFTTKDREHGTGLGLSQVCDFVRQSGGHLLLSSEPDAGTMVTMRLPHAMASPVRLPHQRS